MRGGVGLFAQSGETLRTMRGGSVCAVRSGSHQYNQIPAATQTDAAANEHLSTANKPTQPAPAFSPVRRSLGPLGRRLFGDLSCQRQRPL